LSNVARLAAHSKFKKEGDSQGNKKGRKEKYVGDKECEQLKKEAVKALRE
jgi:hypothetical protein